MFVWNRTTYSKSLRPDSESYDYWQILPSTPNNPIVYTIRKFPCTIEEKNCILHYFVRRGVGHLCLIIKWTDQQMDLKRRPSFYTKMQSLFHAFGSKDAKSLYNCLNSFFRNPQSKTLSLNNSTSISLMFGSWRFLCW